MAKKFAMAKNTKRSPVKTEAPPTKRIKPAVVLDDIFFHKSQLKEGDQLVYYGRWQPLSMWEVVEFRSYYPGKIVGEIKVKRVPLIRHLSDVVTLRNTDTAEVRKVSFSYLSYSAIWRLPGAN